MKNLCMNPYHYGQTGDGGFAEYVVAEAGQLYKLPTDISPDIAPRTEPLRLCSEWDTDGKADTR